MKLSFVFCTFLASLTAWAGTIVVIDKKPSGSSGNVDVRANVSRKVTLAISDTGANDLVGASGIDFGEVDSDGTPGKVPGVPVGPDKAQYVADFVFSATRTGTGNVSLSADRPTPGTFNNTDGILMEDDGGTLQNLSAGGASVSVIGSKPEGDHSKRLGITVHSEDSGTLNSTVRFTLSAF